MSSTTSFDPSLALSTFHSLRDIKPRPIVLPSFEAFALGLGPHMVTTRKEDAPLWSPARYGPGGTRRNADVRDIGLLVADIDGGRVDEVRERLVAFGAPYLMHSTHSHVSPDDAYLRVVVPLSRAVLPAEWPAFIRGAYRRLPCRGLDTSCSDPCRAYHAPSVRPGVTPIWEVSHA